MTFYNDQSQFQQRMSDYFSVLDAGFSFAFQPIIDIQIGKPVGLEALLRGVSGEMANSIIRRVSDENRFAFEQACRMRAIELGTGLVGRSALHLNCGSVSAQDIDLITETTCLSAEQGGLSPDRIFMEFGELEKLGNARTLAGIGQRVRDAGLKVVADNFGSADTGLKRLVVFQPDAVKLDRTLVAGIQKSPRRQAIVLGLIATCGALDIQVIATGVESREEVDWLRDAGIKQFQGYYFARPALERAPDVANLEELHIPPRTATISQLAGTLAG